MFENLIAIGTLVFLEGILSVDNALAMAMLVRPLQPSLRQRALFYGMSGAFILRAGALLSAKWLMNVWWLQFAGALYLLYVAIAHFASRTVTHQMDGPDDSRRSFWMTIAMVELTDAAFAFDSTLVAVGMSDELWVVFAGVALGIIAVRYAAIVFVSLLQRCPEIEHIGFAMVAWVAVRLFAEGWEKMSAVVLMRPYQEHIIPQWLFWAVVGVMAAIAVWFVVGARSARRVVIMIIGSLVLLVGIAMIFLPGPAVVVIPAGLAILATEFAWAQSLLERGRASVRKVLRV
ncbi:MAG TPA: PGPGW domain-containing protein [Candidatus Binataceae bacterium]|nr:PGPGW domain-containing protein [Candidatus Binataceae bacterium]